MICKKCGVAREKIMEPSEEYKKYLGKGFTDHSSDMQTGMTKTPNKKASICADYKFKGYTDCKCKADWNKGIVLDPFMGSGSVALIARHLGRDWVGIELNPEYIKLATDRLRQNVLF